MNFFNSKKSVDMNSKSLETILGPLESSTDVSSISLQQVNPNTYPDVTTSKRLSYSEDSNLSTSIQPQNSYNSDVQPPPAKKSPSNHIHLALADLVSYQDDSSIAGYSLPFLLKQLSDSFKNDQYVNSVSMRRRAALTINILAKRTPFNFDISCINQICECLEKESDRCIIHALTSSIYLLSNHKNCCISLSKSRFMTAINTILGQKFDTAIFFGTVSLHNIMINVADTARQFAESDLHLILFNFLSHQNHKFLTIVIDSLNIISQMSVKVKSDLITKNIESYIIKLIIPTNYENLLWVCSKLVKILSSNHVFKKRCIEIGIINSFQMLLTCSSSYIVQFALLNLLSFTDILSVKLNENQGYFNQLDKLIFMLCRCISSSNRSISQISIQILTNLSCHNVKVKIEALKNRALSSLLLVLNLQKSEEIVIQAFNCLRHLLSITKNVVSIESYLYDFLNMNGFRVAIKIITSNNNVKLVEAALQLVKNLLVVFKSHKLDYTLVNVDFTDLFDYYISQKIMLLDEMMLLLTDSNSTTSSPINNVHKIILQTLSLIYEIIPDSFILKIDLESLLHNLVCDLEDGNIVVSYISLHFIGIIAQKVEKSHDILHTLVDRIKNFQHKFESSKDHDGETIFQKSGELILSITDNQTVSE
ncbi:MAG: Catenin beta-1 [Paramarteilia canceri]